MSDPTLHRLAFTAGFMQQSGAGIATCGARRDAGAKFTAKTSRVTCEGCKAKIAASRARAAEALR